MYIRSMGVNHCHSSDFVKDRPYGTGEYNSKYMVRSTANLIAPAVEYIKKNCTNENISMI